MTPDKFFSMCHLPAQSTVTKRKGKERVPDLFITIKDKSEPGLGQILE